MNVYCVPQDPCPVILDSKCVIYEGENLIYIGVNTNDNLRVALQKINTTIENLVLTGSGITELIGDVIAVGPGVTTATLATVNATPGQFGSSTAIPKLTVDGKGRVTVITTEAVFIPSGALSFIGDVTGTGNTGSDTTLTLATVNSNVYTGNTFLKFGVNAKGLVTSATPVISSDITTALGYTPYNVTNPAGYITGITSSDVTTALGYTPYDAANPANYISRLDLSANAPLSYNNTNGQFSIQEADATHNGYISSTDWNTFNNKQAAGNYITDLNGEATAAGPGVANVTLNNAAVTGKVLTGLNITGGSVAADDSILTAFGKVQNQINGLIGGSIYQGVWDASTNTPALASGVGTKGHYYIVNVAGSTNLDGITDWNLGDWAIFDGTAWQQVDNTDAVVSVNGQTGAVSLTTDNISEGLTNQYFTTSRARLALSGGTGISYDNVTGVISSTITQYTDAMARAAISLTTVGSSGAATYDSITGVLNIPNYTSALTAYVPYTGATANVNLGTYGLISDYLQLNNTPSGIPTTAGTMAWNDTDGTLDIKLKGGNVTLQTGQETLARVVNKTGDNLLEANYQVVRIRTAAEGGAQGQRLAVKLAQANNKAEHTGILGLVTETINDNQEGFITTFGEVREINTTGSLQGETWVDGTTLWLSDTVAGGLTSVEPTTHPVQIGYVVYAHANHGKIFVLLQQGTDELDELHDVAITSVANNDGIFYNSLSSLWENKTIAEVLGYTPANDSLVVHLAGNETITGQKTFSSVITGDAGIILKEGVVPSGVGYTGLAGDADGLVITKRVGSTAYTNLLFFTSATSNTYTFPNASGTLALTSNLSSYVPTSRTITINGTTQDLSANQTWTITPNVNATNTQDYTATAGQTTFTVTGGYTVGQLAVYYNGSKLAAAEYTATNGSTFVLATACQANDIVQAVVSVTGGGIGGSGTTNYHSKWTASGVLSNSLIWDNGTNVGIGNTNTTYTLDVTGTGRFTSDLTSLTIKSTYTGLSNWNSFGNQIFIQPNGANNSHISDNMYYNGGWLLANAGAGAQIYFGASAAGSIDFRTAPTGSAGGAATITNRMTILQGGNVGIGTSSPSYRLDTYTSNQYIGRFDTSDTTGGFIAFAKSGTAYGYVGTSYHIVSGGSVGDMAVAATSNLVFSTGGSLNERLRITSGGTVLVNQSSLSAAGAGQKMQVATDMLTTGSLAGYFWENRSGGVTSNSNWYGWYTTSGTIYLFNGSVNIASINTSSGSYTALSDVNKKKDFEDSTIGLNEILCLKPTLYRMKDEDDTVEKHLGFIAQQVKEFIPQAYIQTKGENEDFIGLDDRPIIAALVKAIQELKIEIDELKNK